MEHLLDGATLFSSSTVRIVTRKVGAASETVVQAGGHHGRDRSAKVANDQFVVNLRMVAVPRPQIGSDVHLSVNPVARILQLCEQTRKRCG